MMKSCKMISIGSNSLKGKIPSSSIGLKSLNFSGWITSKYGIFYRSDSMPALVFHKGFGIKNASKFSQCSSGNNYLSHRTFNYFINPPLQKNLNFFTNCIRLFQDVRTCNKTLTLIKCYTPTPVYQSVNRYFCKGLIEKTEAKLRLQNGLIQNAGHKEIIYKQRKESELNRISAEKEVERSLVKYVIPKTIEIPSLKPEFFSQPFLYTRSFLTSIIPLITDKASKIINIILKGREMPFFKKTEVVTWYENNLGQKGEVKKYLFNVLYKQPSSKMELTHLGYTARHMQIYNKYCNSDGLGPSACFLFFQMRRLYKTSALKPINTVALSYLRRTFNFETSTKKKTIIQKAVISSLSCVKPTKFNYLHYGNIEAVISEIKWKSAADKKIERSFVKYGIPQIINIPSFRQKGNFLDEGSVLSEKLGEKSDKVAQMFKEYSIAVNSGLIFANSMSHKNLRRNSIEAFWKTDPEMSVVKREEKPLNQKYETVKAIKESLLHQNRTLKNKESINVEIREWKNQFIQGFLNQTSLNKIHTPISVFPTMLSYSHNAFNFESAGPRPGLTSASTKKVYDDLKISGVFSQDIATLSYQKIRDIDGLQFENIFNPDTKPEREYLSPFFSDVNGTREIVDSDIAYSLGELVLKKSDSKKTGIETENNRNTQNQKLSPTETLKDSGKDILRGKKTREPDIGMIADRVYKIIEKRISIEKDRRGLF